MVLVTGAAGKTGRAVIAALARRGVAVRALVRRESQLEEVKSHGAREALVGDIGSEPVYRRALDGMSAAYHICPNMHPEETAVGRTAITAALETGLDRFVYHSVLHPQTEKMPHHWQKLRVEEALYESGLDITILQPAPYMQNVLGSRDSILRQGVYPVPYPVETRISLVDLNDLAAAAAIVLTEPGHAGAVYELAGCETFSQTEMAGILTRVLGRSVRAAEITLDDWRRRARAAGLGSYQVDTLARMFDYYASYGFTGNGNVLRWLLGRQPATFAAFATRELISR